MSSSEHVRALMSEIGPIMEFSSVLKVEDEDRWVLNLDGANVIVAEYFAEDDRLFLTSDAGVPPPEARLACYELLLAYNSMWRDSGGMRMALDREDGSVLQICDVAGAGLNGEALRLVLENFIRQLGDWMQFVASVPAAEASEEPNIHPDAIQV